MRNLQLITYHQPNLSVTLKQVSKYRSNRRR